MSKHKKAGRRGTLIIKLKRLACVYVFLTSDIYSIMNLERAVAVIEPEVLLCLVWTRSADSCDFTVRFGPRFQHCLTMLEEQFGQRFAVFW